MIQQMSGVRKAAIVVMALGEENSAKLFKHLDEHEIELIAKEVAVLGAGPAEMGEKVLDEVNQMPAEAERISTGGVEQERRLLPKSLGADQSRRTPDRVVK